MENQKTEPLQKVVGENLKQIRKKLKLTLKEAGELTGRPFNELSRIERGKRNFNIDTLEKLAAGYGLEIIIKFKEAKTKKIETT